MAKTSKKEWFYFTSNLLGIFTFIMVAIIFFTGIALAVRIAITFQKSQALIDEMKKYIQQLEVLIKQQGAQWIEQVKESNVPQMVRQGVQDVKQKTVQTAQAVKQDVMTGIPSEENNYTMPFSNRSNGMQYHLLG